MARGRRRARSVAWFHGLFILGLIGCAGAVPGAVVPHPVGLPDADSDGIANASDECADSKEDGKDPLAIDGCPFDADADGVKGTADKCPQEPETWNGFQDEDGCPDTKPVAKLALKGIGKVRVTQNEIKIDEEILFETAKANIDHSSDELVANVAKAMVDNVDLNFVEIAGHADVRGFERVNNDLTQARAEAVMKDLVKHGVAQTRLRAAGYGSYCPIDEKHDEDAYRKNRRVEFKILRRGGKDLDVKWGGCDHALAKGLKPEPIPASAPTTATPPSAVAEAPKEPEGPKTVGPAKDAEDECNKGDLHACNALGLFLESGSGIVRDLGKAEASFRQACAGGDTVGCANLGELLETERAKSDAYGAADLSYQAACSKGTMQGCDGLGSLFEHGRGVKQDFVRAVGLYKEGCEGGDAPACEAWGMLVIKGQGVAADRGFGSALLNTSCKLHYERACDELKQYPPLKGSAGADVSATASVDVEGSTTFVDKGEPDEPIHDCVPTDASECTKMCEKGSAASCNSLGVIFMYGTSRRQDYSQALDLFTKAGEKGYVHAYSNIGILHEGGYGRLTVDFAAAKASYQKACDGHDLVGCTNLGWLFARGRGVDQDYAKAQAYFKQSCDGGELNGCDALGTLHAKGLGVTASAPHAEGYFKLACEGGIATACEGSGDLLVKGPTYDHGVELLKLSCDEHYKLGCEKLKEATHTADRTHVVKASSDGSLGLEILAIAFFPVVLPIAYFSEDHPKKADLHCKLYDEKGCVEACAANGGDACDTLGLIYAYGAGAKQDYEKAFTSFTKASTAGFVDAHVNLGLMWEGGAGRVQDFDKARAEFQIACDKKDLAGCTNLGEIYFHGKGVTADKAKAIGLFNTSCTGGEPNACADLGNIYMSGDGAALDYAKASLDLRIACDGGSAAGCASYGELLVRGIGVKWDRERGIALIDWSCKEGLKHGCELLTEIHTCKYGDIAACQIECTRGDSHACFGLGSIYLEGVEVRPDSPKAAAYFKQAYTGALSTTGSAAACASTRDQAKTEAKAEVIAGSAAKADVEAQAKAAADMKAAAEMKAATDAKASSDLVSASDAKKACDGGNGSGCLKLASYYTTGSGVPEDKTKATDLLKKGCDAGYPSACADYGTRVANGVGVTADRPKGLELLKKECKKGNKLACDSANDLEPKAVAPADPKPKASPPPSPAPADPKPKASPPAAPAPASPKDGGDKPKPKPAK